MSTVESDYLDGTDMEGKGWDFVDMVQGKAKVFRYCATQWRKKPFFIVRKIVLKNTTRQGCLRKVTVVLRKIL